jgi:DNA-binding transcriptional regulator LsrR (DeoR family)
MELYLKVRRAHFQDGLSGRQIAKDYGVSRECLARTVISIGRRNTLIFWER